jgi:hypothetical protein
MQLYKLLDQDLYFYHDSPTPAWAVSVMHQRKHEATRKRSTELYWTLAESLSLLDYRGTTASTWTMIPILYIEHNFVNNFAMVMLEYGWGQSLYVLQQPDIFDFWHFVTAAARVRAAHDWKREGF